MAVHHEPGLIASPIPRPFIFQFRYTANPGLSYLVQGCYTGRNCDWQPAIHNGRRTSRIWTRIRSRATPLDEPQERKTDFGLSP